MSIARRRLRVVTFTSSHVEPAARLLAERHRRDRSRNPALPAAYERVNATLPLVQQAFLSETTSGVVASLGGEIVGFLFGQRVMFPPDSTIAPYYRPMSMLVRYTAHATVANGRWDIYRELYAVAAERWGTEGHTDHYVQLPSGDDVVIDA